MQELLKTKNFIFGNNENIFVSFDEDDILMNPFKNGILSEKVKSISFVCIPYAVATSNFYVADDGDVYLPNVKCSYKDLFSYQRKSLPGNNYEEIIKFMKDNIIAKHNVKWDEIESHLFESIFFSSDEDIYYPDLEVFDKLPITVLNCDNISEDESEEPSKTRRIPVVKKAIKKSSEKNEVDLDEDTPLPPKLTNIFDFVKYSPKNFVFNCYMSPETYLGLDLYDRIIINPEMFSNFVLNDRSVDFNYDKKEYCDYGIVLQCKQRENIFIYNIPENLHSQEENIILCIKRSLEHRIRVNGEKTSVVIVHNNFTKKSKMISFSQILLEHFAVVLYQKDNS